MRRSVASRIFAAVWAIWFVTALAEPAALHTCAMHGMAHGGHSASASNDAAARAHVALHSHAATNGSSPAPSHAACTCIGGCCVAIAAELPGASIILVGSATSQTGRVFPPAIAAYRPTTPEHARPPSHAPPFLTA